MTSHSCMPCCGAITGRTRLMRRSALVKVPSFSRKEVPGRKTWAKAAVSFEEEMLHDEAVERFQSGHSHAWYWDRTGHYVLTLDDEAFEGAFERGIEHIGDAQARARCRA